MAFAPAALRGLARIWHPSRNGINLSLVPHSQATQMKLSDLAQIIRSKNAGPRRLTMDVMFATDADYQRVAQSPVLGAEAVARLYGMPTEAVTVIPYPAGRAIKIVMARRVMAGDPGDVDVYGAQQHGPLLGIEL
jgi:hypothetical protein